jgi:acyl carrier protein
MNYVDTVRKFVVENFLFGDSSTLNDDTSFLEDGVIDSTGILELVFFLEETYGIKVEDDELLPENLDTLRNIEAFLERKTAGVAARREEM